MKILFDVENMSGWLEITDKKIKIKIDGSNDFKDWYRTNFSFLPILRNGIFWHTGFYRGWMLIHGMIAHIIRNNPTITEVRIAGTSLGGAVATVGAYFLKKKFPNIKVSCLNSSGPSVIWLIGKNRYNKIVDHFSQLRVGSDIVSRLPQWGTFVSWKLWFWTALYKKIGNLEKIKSGRRWYQWRPKYFVLDHLDNRYYSAVDVFLEH